MATQTVDDAVEQRFALADFWKKLISEEAQNDEVVFCVDRMDDQILQIDEQILGRVPRSIPELRAALRLYRQLVEWDADGPAERLFRVMMSGLDRIG